MDYLIEKPQLHADCATWKEYCFLGHEFTIQKDREYTVLDVLDLYLTESESLGATLLLYEAFCRRIVTLEYLTEGKGTL